MSRQFKSTDTSKWLEGFGNGAAGSATISGTYGAGVGGYLGACSGTSGQFSLTTPNGWSVNYGGWICFIHQTQGTGAGNWELNRIMNISGTTSTLKYPLQNAYSTGAQCILAVPYSSVTIGDLALPAWNGTIGGIGFILDNGSTSVTGTLNGTGKGFRGGSGVIGPENYAGAVTAYSGEGSTGVSSQTLSPNPNGNGAGVNKTGDNGNFWLAGSGGGNATAGTAGSSSNANGQVGAPGAQVGTAANTSLYLGGGGNGAVKATNTGSSQSCGAGSAGGGIWVIVSRNFTNSGSITLSGVAGVSGTIGGGGGAAGCFLGKFQTATLGTITGSAGAGGTGTVGSGGAGSVGRIHADYVVSYSGSTTPTIDVTQDLTLRQPIKRRMVV